MHINFLFANVLKTLYLCNQIRSKMNTLTTQTPFKEHVKNVAEQHGKTIQAVCENLKGGVNAVSRDHLTRNSLFVKLKNESVKISYLPELSTAIGCTTVELIPAPEGFEHKYDEDGKYLGCFRSEWLEQ